MCCSGAESGLWPAQPRVQWGSVCCGPCQRFETTGTPGGPAGIESEDGSGRAEGAGGCGGL